MKMIKKALAVGCWVAAMAVIVVYESIQKPKPTDAH
jgi:hypothetical protein